MSFLSTLVNNLLPELTLKNFLEGLCAIIGILVVILSCFLPWYAYFEWISYYYVNKNGETINVDATKIIQVDEQTYWVFFYLVLAATFIDPVIVIILYTLIGIPVYSAINQLK